MPLPSDQAPANASLAENAPPDSSLAEAQAREPWRFWIIALGFTLLACLVLIRLLSYQIFSDARPASSYVLPVERMPRGTIVDRDGNVLTLDRYFYEISATPIFLDEAERQEIARQLATLIGLDANATLATLTSQSDQQFALLAKRVSLEGGDKILAYKAAEEEGYPATPFAYLHVTLAPERVYPEGRLAGHVLGFVGVDVVTESARRGYYGVEGYYDRYLWRNGVGLTARAVDTAANLEWEVRRYLPSVAGKDLVLTLDRTIQWIAEDELRKGVNAYRATGGTMIVMVPKTGAILALADLPDYDPNQYGTTDPERYVNPAISAQYEPGSIFKIITVAAGLDSELIEPTMIFTDSGSISLGERIFFNSNRVAHGRITVSEALARSLNVVTVQIAAKVGAETFYQYVRRFGFGTPSEIDLSGEVNGLLKQPGTHDWSVSDLGTNSFGQGLAVTPIQMINAAASIANGGILMRPYTVQARLQDDKLLYTKPTVARSTMSAAAAAALTEMMVNVVETGAPAARVRGYRIAGKTGTAQIPTQEGYTEDETIVSFVGLAPAENPQFVVLIKLDRPDPTISPWATYTAAPVFSKVAKRLLDHLNIPPDAIRLAQAQD